MTPAELVAAALAQLAPPAVAVGARPVTGGRPGDLVGDEARVMATAIPLRRREFAAGRALLRELTGTTGEIGVRADRAPAAPPGWVVSLAHDRDVVAAVAAPTSVATALGVDVEPIAPLDDGMVDIVLRADDAELDPLAAFVAKEACYKAWSAPGRRILEHHDVRLRLGPGHGDFAAEVVAADVERAALSGRLVQAAGRWLAVCVVPAR